MFNSTTQLKQYLKEHGILDSDILTAAVVNGSLPAGQADEYSDIDIDLIYSDENFIPLEIPDGGYIWDIHHHYAKNYLLGMDRSHWHVSSFVTASVILDKTGAVREKIKSLITLDPEEAHDQIAAMLDGYYNAFYRSIKSAKRGQHLGAHTMACQSLGAINTMLYNLNGVIGTYINRLPTTIHTLRILPMPSGKLLALMEKIARTADVNAQIDLYRIIRDYMNQSGYKTVHEAWDGKLEKAFQ